MKITFILPFLAIALLLSSCGGKSSISTAEEWVKFTSNHNELKSVYDEFGKISSEDAIYIYEELSSIVGNGRSISNYSNEDICTAYWCIYAMIPMDMDINPDKYTAAQSDQFLNITNRQTDIDAQRRTMNVIGDARMVEMLKRMAFISGSRTYQNFFEGR